MDVKKDILWRIYLSFIGIIVLGAVVLGRVVYIQKVQGDYWKQMSNEQHLKYFDINAERGTIYSEDGNMLSTSIPVFDVYIDFGADGLLEKNGKRFFSNLDSLSIDLAALFKDATAATYKKILKAGYKNEDRYFPLKKKITFEQYEALRSFPLVRQGQNKSGFIVDVRDNRVNPYVLLANRTIGLSRGDTTKNVGLERSYDSVLKGQSGRRLMRYMAGAYVPVDGAQIEPEHGKDIITTIDTYIQDVAENALMKMMVSNSSFHGTCIVMETKTGKIKAIANLGRMPDGEYFEDYNYGLGKRTEPGSIFKIATLISLLEDKYMDTGSIVDCHGGITTFHGLKVRDTHSAYEITLKEAFARSSNVAFAELANEYYNEQPWKFYDHLHYLHLDTATGIDIVGAAPPLIKKPSSKYWTKTTIPFMAHGYEELVTPLQLLMLYNAVGNNGKMMRPYLVSSINDMGHQVETFSPKVVVEKICSDETLAKLKECLLAVVQFKDGTAHTLETNMYSFAGKTGTAVTAINNHGYNKSAKIYQSAFMGYFPAEDPMYTVGVVIQNSNQSKLFYGSSVSGPVFREVADKIYAEKIGNQSVNSLQPYPDSASKFYGLKNDVAKILSMFSYPTVDSATTGIWRAAFINNSAANVNTTSIDQSPANKIPDVTGLGLKDAVYLLENMGLKVEAKGRGKVIYQSLAQNSDYHKGQLINIQLN